MRGGSGIAIPLKQDGKWAKAGRTAAHRQWEREVEDYEDVRTARGLRWSVSGDAGDRRCGYGARQAHRFGHDRPRGPDVRCPPSRPCDRRRHVLCWPRERQVRQLQRGQRRDVDQRRRVPRRLRTLRCQLPRQRAPEERPRQGFGDDYQGVRITDNGQSGDTVAFSQHFSRSLRPAHGSTRERSAGREAPGSSRR